MEKLSLYPDIILLISHLSLAKWKSAEAIASKLLDHYKNSILNDTLSKDSKDTLLKDALNWIPTKAGGRVRLLSQARYHALILVLAAATYRPSGTTFILSLYSTCEGTLFLGQRYSMH